MWGGLRRVAPAAGVAALAAGLGTGVALASRPAPRPRPLLTTGAARELTPTSALVTGTLDRRRLARAQVAFLRSHATRSGHVAPVDAYFEYGSGAGYRLRSSRRPVGHAATVLGTSVRLTGLTAGTRYHYRLVVAYAGGLLRAPARSFTTRDPSRDYPQAPTAAPAVVSPAASPPTGSSAPTPSGQAPPASTPAPAASTGGASDITQSSAALGGTVNAHGSATTVDFQYGETTAYGLQTTEQGAGAGASDVPVSANVGSLSPGTSYHYRLVARSGAGTTTGSDQVFTTTPTPQQVAARRAVATYQSMQRYFYAASVYPGDASSLYAPNNPQTSRKYSYLWPFTRALVGTLTLSGIPPVLLGGTSYTADVNDRLTGLARYADGSGYDSYPLTPWGTGGDKYYDDQAWVGLALAAHYNLTHTSSSLAGAQGVFHFVYPSGWDGGAGVDPGGTFWVLQGVGAGQSNHDRTATANAPNAELGFLLAALDPQHADSYTVGAQNMYDWVNHYLYNVHANPTDPRAPNPNFDPGQPAIVMDKIAGSNSVGKAHWTYNQGALIAADAALYRRTSTGAYLSAAETLARSALDTFSEQDYVNTQPAAFNAIFFRDLLQLYTVTADTDLKARILQTIDTYAQDAWDHHRDSRGLFNFPASAGTNAQLLDQGAMLQIYAALAWDPSAYSRLP